MLQTIIKINNPSIIVSNETLNKFIELRESLPKDIASAKTFKDGSFIKLYHNQETDRIDVLFVVSDLNGELVNPYRFAEIELEFNKGDLNVLGFHFKSLQRLVLSEDGYKYSDYYGFYKLINELLEDEIFKIG